MPTPTSPGLKRTQSFYIADSLDKGNASIDFATLRLLGKGGQGEIYSVQVEISDPKGSETRLCVLKRMFHSPRGGSRPFATHDMITGLDRTTVDHRVLKLIRVVNHNDETYALLPYCEAFLNNEMPKIYRLGDKALDPLLKFAITVHIAINVLRALSHMHEKGFVHGDLTPHNIAYHLGWCLIDLDLSKLIGTITSVQGTGYYIHPAAIKDSELIAQPFSDVFALGVILNSLLNPNYYPDLMKTTQFVHLYAEIKKYAATKKEFNDEIPPLSGIVTLIPDLAIIEDDLAALVLRMTALDERQIPKASDLLTVFEQLNEKLFQLDPTLNERLHRYYVEMLAANAAKAPPLRFFPSVSGSILVTSEVASPERGPIKL